MSTARVGIDLLAEAKKKYGQDARPSVGELVMWLVKHSPPLTKLKDIKTILSTVTPVDEVCIPVNLSSLHSVVSQSLLTHFKLLNAATKEVVDSANFCVVKLDYSTASSHWITYSLRDVSEHVTVDDEQLEIVKRYHHGVCLDELTHKIVMDLDKYKNKDVNYTTMRDVLKLKTLVCDEVFEEFKKFMSTSTTNTNEYHWDIVRHPVKDFAIPYSNHVSAANRVYGKDNPATSFMKQDESQVRIKSSLRKISFYKETDAGQAQEDSLDIAVSVTTTASAAAVVAVSEQGKCDESILTAAAVSANVDQFDFIDLNDADVVDDIIADDVVSLGIGKSYSVFSTSNISSRSSRSSSGSRLSSFDDDDIERGNAAAKKVLLRQANKI